MFGHGTFCLLALILNFGQPRCEYPDIIDQHISHVGIGDIPDHLSLIGGSCLLSLLGEQVLYQLLSLSSLEGASLELHFVFIRLDGSIRGAHGHEGKDDVVGLGYAGKLVDLVEVDVLWDQVDVLLFHQLIDFLLLLLLVADLLFFFFIIITTTEFLVLRCLWLLFVHLSLICRFFLLRLFRLLFNYGLLFLNLFFFILLVLCRSEGLSLNVCH